MENESNVLSYEIVTRPTDNVEIREKHVYEFAPAAEALRAGFTASLDPLRVPQYMRVRFAGDHLFTTWSDIERIANTLKEVN